MRYSGYSLTMANPEGIKILREIAQSEPVKRLEKALGPGAELHLVGGTVRDSLLGTHTKDLDFASRLHPEVVKTELEAQGIHCIPIGARHQTVTALLDSEYGQVEITTFRGAKLSPKGGVIASDNIETDLRYRDFTINALAFSLSDQSLVDPLNASADVESRLIRCVGSPVERFREDPLRILRMIRFACLPQFELDKDTKLVGKSLITSLAKVSSERIRDELTKILVSKLPERGLRLLAEIEFLELFLPEIESFINFEQNSFHHLDLFEHTLKVVSGVRPVPVLRLAALLHDVGKPATLSIDPKTAERHFFKHESVGERMARKILERFKYSRFEQEQVSTLVATHMRPLDAGPGGLRRLLRDTDEIYPLWRELKEADGLACKIDSEDYLEKLADFDRRMKEIQAGPKVSPLKSLAINGSDLLAIGRKQGPQIGEILRALHEKVLDNPDLNNKETLLELVEAIETELGQER